MSRMQGRDGRSGQPWRTWYGAPGAVGWGLAGLLVGFGTAMIWDTPVPGVIAVVLILALWIAFGGMLGDVWRYSSTGGYDPGQRLPDSRVLDPPPRRRAGNADGAKPSGERPWP